MVLTFTKSLQDLGATAAPPWFGTMRVEPVLAPRSCGQRIIDSKSGRQLRVLVRLAARWRRTGLSSFLPSARDSRRLLSLRSACHQAIQATSKQHDRTNLHSV